jgi:hypothetical protein
VLDNSKSCYDAAGIYVEVFGTLIEAKEFINKYDNYDRQYFEIIKESI